MITFIQNLCRDVLKIEKEIPISRAHRIGQEQEERTRPVIVNFVNYNGKRDILKAAWSKKEIVFNETRIYLDHDLTTKVKQQRVKYRPLRGQLQEQELNLISWHLQN